LDLFPYAAVLPLVLILGGFTFFPLGYAGWSSFHRLLLTSPLTTPFIGLDNYVQVVQDASFWDSLTTTLLFTLVVTSATLVLALAFALLLNKPIRAAKLVQVFVLLPWAIPTVGAGIIWKWIFNGSYGPLNGALYSLGVIRHYQPWLGESATAQLAVAVACVWQAAPLATVLFLAALQLIPKDLLEAVWLDGGGSGQALRAVILPLLLPTIMVLAIYLTMMSLTTFDLVYVMTGGGPGDATSLLSYLAYVQIFKGLNLGTGAALAFIIALISLVFIAFYLRLLRSEELR
jgi:ABC-type sugar transport system permease subunit